MAGKQDRYCTAGKIQNLFGSITLQQRKPFIPGRTFASIVAGMIRLDFRRFVLLTFIGSVVWIVSFVSVGFFIGSRPFLKPWLKYIVIAFILIVTLSLILRMVKELKKLQKEN